MIRIVAVGQPKKQEIVSLLEFYTKQMKHVSVEYVQQEKGNNASRIIKEEGHCLLQKIKNKEYCIALTEEGKQYTSLAFSDVLKKLQQPVVCVVGGAFGLDKEIKKRANLLLSLSHMTLQHDLALLVFVEQLYRAGMINKGREYQK